MKRTLLIIGLAGLALVACKKDRKCLCKYTSTVKTPTTTHTNSGGEDEFTMTNTSLRTAFNHCTHKKYVTKTDTLEYTIDEHCELK